MGKKVRKHKTDSKGQKKRKWKISFKIPKFLLPNDEPIVARTFTVVDYIVGFLVFLLSFQMYLETLTPTVPFGDSGNFITCCYTLGITQPTGYPTYLMIGHLFTYLPFGNIAWRLNLISAIAASLACLILYLLLLKVQSFRFYKQGRKDSLVFQYILPTIISLLLAVSSTFWSQAIVAEVYTLNALFLLLMVLLLLIWRQRVINYTYQTNLRVHLPLYLFAFVCGLSFTHHLSTIFIIPAAIFWILITDKKIFIEYKRCGLLILLFLIGLLPYLYLPIMSSVDVSPKWENISTLERFINHVTGKEFQGRITFLSINEKSIFQLVNSIKLKEYFILFTNQFTIYIWWIGIIGLGVLFKKNFKLLLLLLLIFVADVFYSINYQIGDIEVYYIPSFVIWVIFIGYGIKWILSLLETLKFKRFIVKRGIIYVLYTLFLFSLILSYNKNYYQNDKSKYYFSYDFGRNILRQLPPKTILFVLVEGDTLPIWYHKYIEKAREDVAIIRLYWLNRAWYVSKIKNRYPWLKIKLNEEPVKGLYFNYQPIFKKIITDNVELFPIYFVFRDPLVDSGCIKNEYLIKEGILSKYLNKTTEAINTLKNHNYIYRGIFDKKVYKDSWAKALIRLYKNDWLSKGKEYIRLKKYIEAELVLKMAIKLQPDDVNSHHQLGWVYFQQKKYDLAIKEYQKVLEIDVKYIPTYINLGFLYEDIGDIEKAIDVYKKVLNVDPKNIEIHDALARAYYKNDMLDKVIEECKKIIKINPNHINAYRNMGSIYYMKGMYDQAVEVFNHLLTLDPDNSYAKQIVEIIRKTKNN